MEYMDKIIGNYVKIGKWELDIESMTGSFSFHDTTVDTSAEEIVYYGTPFWEGVSGIDFAWADSNGKYKSEKIIPFTISGDNKVDFDNYVKIMSKYLPK